MRPGALAAALAAAIDMEMDDRVCASCWASCTTRYFIGKTLLISMRTHIRLARFGTSDAYTAAKVQGPSPFVHLSIEASLVPVLASADRQSAVLQLLLMLSCW